MEASPVQQRLMEFIRKEFQPGYNHYNVSKLIGDASARQYFRYVTESGHSFILAAYPEPFDPERFSYRQIYDLLRAISLPVPEILRVDGSLGIVLQQDLGNDSLQRVLLKAGEAERRNLLQHAIEHILVLQHRGTPHFGPHCEGYRLAFDGEKLLWELHFFRRHFLGNYRRIDLSQDQALEGEFGRLAEELAALPRWLCHRDYHVRNLMLLDDLLYIIDFQDARWGPACYDLVSLLKDSVELEPAEVASLVKYYLQRAREMGLHQIEPEIFWRQFHLMTIQRLLKALGTYGYQIVVRGHFIYEQYMAGSLHRALMALEEIPEFPRLRDLVQEELSRSAPLGTP